MSFIHVTEIAESTPTKIVLLVADGLGGLAHPETGLSELETARLPNLNALAAKSVLGLTVPVHAGVTPGSGPGHLSLFGYDPLEYPIKRGIMEALGVGIPVRAGEIAARGNFCTVDGHGVVADRRAGRLPSEQSEPLCALLNKITVSGAEVAVHPVKDHRFVAVFHGEGLSDEVTETDPGKVGVAPVAVRATAAAGEKMARIANEFAAKAKQALAGRSPANMVLVRGFSGAPTVPSMMERFKLKPAAIASYPMYRGLAQIVGMDVLRTGNTMDAEIETLREQWGKYDFFFVHYKHADAAGEDGDFPKKVRVLEEFDSYLPKVLALKPDVLMVAGDHSTPAVMGGHSWHPVPFLLHARLAGADGVAGFNERTCARGSLGRFPAKDSLMLAMACALKLVKYGA
ncbi:MAG: 2,3-bisphosphoglycerate-independent phosphoglycerate mutase [Dehalococcoidia bacterium]|nr:2,3-bisphosphoglycerate-independent phosphoglycerate mutase [Dehalococcoidia bacterium]